MSPYPRLLEPISIGNLRFANRIAMTPHSTGMSRDGAVSDHEIAYYESRARTRPGLMIIGVMFAHAGSTMRAHTVLEAFSEDRIDGLRRLSSRVHAHGVKVIGQLGHRGREQMGAESDHVAVAPSAIRSPRDLFMPHELREREIAPLIHGFGDAARILEVSEYDGAEIHAAHGYLVAQFLSPETNHRSDRYGGSPERRMRFLLETIDAIRSRCRSDFILGVRLSADEETENGLGLQDTIAIATELERLGGVDYLSITLGTRGSYVKDVTQPEATAGRAAHIIREASRLPILVGQRITSPEVAERMLTNGDADMVGMARAFIADPEWAEKARRGEGHRIRRCIGLNQDCRAFYPHLHCAINPSTGREHHPRNSSAAPPRKIAIVGAGPAGLETATVAAARGHVVTLFEASLSPGGQFLYASSLPHRADLRRFIDHLVQEARHLNVKMELGVRIDDVEQVRAFDSVVVATGAVARPLDDAMVGDHSMTWFDVLENGPPAPYGDARALVVDDGSAFWWTYGVAEMLTEAGWRVLVATPSAAIASGIPAESLGPLLARLGQAQTEYRILSSLTRVVGKSACLTNVASGDDEEIPCDLVVVQTGRAPVSGLIEVLESAGLEVNAVGDCVAPRRISHAVFEGNRLGNTL